MLFESKHDILWDLPRTYNLGKAAISGETCPPGSSACLAGVLFAIVQFNSYFLECGNVPKTEKTAKRGKAPFNKDKRRRHHHFLVTISYADGEKFGRVYTDKEKASRFADRQRRSPVVKAVNVAKVS